MQPVRPGVTPEALAQIQEAIEKTDALGTLQRLQVDETSVLLTDFSGERFTNTTYTTSGGTVIPVLEISNPEDPANATRVVRLEGLQASIEAAQEVAVNSASVNAALDSLNSLRAVVVTPEGVTLSSSVPGNLSPGTFTTPKGATLNTVQVDVSTLGQVSVLRADTVSALLGELADTKIDLEQSQTDLQNTIIIASLAVTEDDSGGVVLSFDRITPPTAPTGLTVTPVSSGITLNWTNTAGDATAIVVQRSADGVTYTDVVSNLSPSATTYTFAPGLSTAVYVRVAAVRNNARSNYTAAVYQAARYPAGAQALYLFEDGSGTSVTDRSGGGHPGTLVTSGSPAVAPAWLSGGAGVELAGGGYLDFGAVGAVGASGLHVLAALWIPTYASGDTAGVTLLSRWYSGGDARSEYTLTLDQSNATNTGRASLSTKAGGAVATFTGGPAATGAPMQTGSWHWLEVLYTGGIRYLRVDGSEYSAAGAAPAPGALTFQMGLNAATATKPRFRVAALGLWQRPLSAAERTQYLTAENARLAGKGITMPGGI